MWKDGISLAKCSCAARVVSERTLFPSVKELVLEAPEIALQVQPGQFVQLAVPEHLLRRPISVAYAVPELGQITLIYRIVGSGTERLAQVKAGDTLSVMGPLGQGFYLEGQKLLLVGGGMGIAPLIFLAQQSHVQRLEVLLGGRSALEMVWQNYFDSVSDQIHMTTDDGSMGHHGFVTDLLPDLLAGRQFDMVVTCGPNLMMQKVAQVAESFNIPCQVSFERFMACGVGACLSCTCAGTTGKRLKVCTDGPVFWSKEVLL